MNIHIIGDSHAHNGWEMIDRYQLQLYMNNIGPKLCYSFGRDKLNCLNIKKYNVENNGIVIFCFGEIDCRCHINKHVTKERTYQMIIDDIVENYFKAIEENVKQYDNLYIAVFNVVPPVEKYNTVEYEEFPFLGSDEERKSYVLYFNKKLEEYCNKYNYFFFNVYDKYCDSNGFLNKELSDSNVHILNPVYMKFMLELFLYNISMRIP